MMWLKLVLLLSPLLLLAGLLLGRWQDRSQEEPLPQGPVALRPPWTADDDGEEADPEVLRLRQEVQELQMLLLAERGGRAADRADHTRAIEALKRAVREVESGAVSAELAIRIAQYGWDQMSSHTKPTVAVQPAERPEQPALSGETVADRIANYLSVPKQPKRPPLRAVFAGVGEDLLSDMTAETTETVCLTVEAEAESPEKFSNTGTIISGPRR